MGRWKSLLLAGAAAPLMLAAGLAADGPPSDTCKVARLQAAPPDPGKPADKPEGVELTRAEGVGLYLCLFGEMQGGYARSGDRSAAAYVDWDIQNAQPFVSEAHGGRYVNVYANEEAADAGRMAETARMPPGAVFAMDSFTVTPAGLAEPGPLFLMEKTAAGGEGAAEAWRYALIEPDGRLGAEADIARCAECHRRLGAEHDSLAPVPEPFRLD